MSKIDLIIDALSISQNSVWSKLNEQALAAARELKAEKQEPDKPLRLSPVYEYGHIHEASHPEQEPVAWVKKLNTMIIGCADVINEDGVHEDAKKLAKLVKKDCYEILRSLEEKNGD